MITGLIPRPFAGVGSGLIGGVHRYLMGGITAVPCSLATVLAGAIGGVIYLKYKKRFCRIEIAVVFAVLMECLHMFHQLTMLQPFQVAVEIVSTSAILMVAANAIGMAAFAIIITDFLKKEKEE